jgi:hypothetical protein
VAFLKKKYGHMGEHKVSYTHVTKGMRGMKGVRTNVELWKWASDFSCYIDRTLRLLATACLELCLARWLAEAASDLCALPTALSL